MRFLATEDAKQKEREVIAAYEQRPLTREELDWLEAGEWRSRAPAHRAADCAGCRTLPRQEPLSHQLYC